MRGQRAVAVGALAQRQDIQAVAVVEAAERVADGDDLRAHLMEDARRHAADVAEALHGDRAVRAARMPNSRERLARDEDDAAPGRFVAALRAADGDRLAGDDGRNGVALRSWSRCPSSRP